MNKENLFYVVTKGTNERVLTQEHFPIRGIKADMLRELPRWGSNHELISVKDYDDMFSVNIE